MIEKMFRIRDMTDLLVDSNIALKDRYLNEEDWNEINVNKYLFSIHIIFFNADFI